MTPLNAFPDATWRHDAAGDGDAAHHDGHDAAAAAARRRARRGQHGRPGGQHGRPARCRRPDANDGIVRGEHAGPRGLGGAAGTLFNRTYFWLEHSLAIRKPQQSTRQIRQATV